MILATFLNSEGYFLNDNVFVFKVEGRCLCYNVFVITVEGDSPSSVEQWLQSLHLSDYLDTFHANNFTSMDRIRNIWELELNSVSLLSLAKTIDYQCSNLIGSGQVEYFHWVVCIICVWWIRLPCGYSFRPRQQSTGIENQNGHCHF